MAEMLTIPAIYYGQCKSLFEEIKNLEYAVVKGEPLSLFAYGELGKRRSSDIDILISRGDIIALEKALLKNSFQTPNTDRTERILILSGSHQTKSWSKDISPLGFVCIDVNFDVFWGEYTGVRFDMKEFLSDVIEINVYGCIIKTLTPIKQFTQLVLHHYKEMNSIYHLSSHNSINLKMFNDVYQLYKNSREITIESVCEIAQKYKIVPYVFYVLYYTNQVFLDDEISKILELLETDEGNALLDCYGLSSLERKKWKVDFLTRLNSDDMFDLIKNDLDSKDIEKLERNMRMFR